MLQRPSPGKKTAPGEPELGLRQERPKCKSPLGKAEANPLARPRAQSLEAAALPAFIDSMYRMFCAVK